MKLDGWMYMCMICIQKSVIVVYVILLSKSCFDKYRIEFAIVPVLECEGLQIVQQQGE